MARTTDGNTALRAAMLAAGIGSNRALREALERTGRSLGIPQYSVSLRQVARWLGPNPPWPRDEHQRVMVELLRMPLSQLGFGGQQPPPAAAPVIPPAPRPAVPHPAQTDGVQPETIGAAYAAITAAHRQMYWTVAPATLHRSVAEHSVLGEALLGETSGVARRVLAAALAESLLLLGRIEFFDLRQPAASDATLVRALHAAGAADDQLLGAAILGHAAFVPGWAGQREEMAERMRGARAYARRGNASAEIHAWLDAVEAECLTKCGDHREALRVLHHASDLLGRAGGVTVLPEWFGWFSTVRLAAFLGHTQLIAGHLPQARTTLTEVLAGLGEEDGKQRVVVLADLAAVEARAGRPAEACQHLEVALDQLRVTWYATGMERVREARRLLIEWQDTAAVQAVDDRLYSWSATLSSLQR
ncbi:transcriptional regulator [Kitasatospora sp. CB02891]|uniref:transcriptional regulator n=1 Tax=Kitasatospora sp. CB02891 TaxID=2020329 RepID=UPI000C27A8B7|nr:transcriptional regulator [Kitasatospora sp. CB02891]PJN24077.1 transcriptional regulator [Kitasatospora sp. CB02891]